MNLLSRTLGRTEGKDASLTAATDAGTVVTRARAGATVLWIMARRIQLAVRRQGPVGATAAAVLLAAVGVAVFGWVPSLRESGALQSQLSAPLSLSTPGQSGPGLTASGFAAKLPTRAELPAALAVVYAQAEAANISLPRGTYSLVSGKDGTSRYQITLPVECNYASLRRFVEGVLAQIPAAALSGVRMQRQDVGSALIEAELEFVIYVREPA